MRHIWSITIVLVILSILSLFNVLSFDGELTLSDFFTKQFIFISIGWLVYILFSKIDYSIFKFYQLNILIYILTIFLLISTLIWGPLINNTQRWLLFGDFQFQPSELAKLTIIFCVANLFTLKGKLNLWLLLALSFLRLIPILAIVYIQPHGSMSIILLLLWSILIFTVMPQQVRNLILLSIIFCSMVFVLTITLELFVLSIFCFVIFFTLSVFSFYAKENMKKLTVFALSIGIVLGILSSITWSSLLLDYQKARIEAFFNPVETSQDLGFNVDQSRIAIGSGRIFGKGWGFGTQSKLNFLPEHKTDFVFASFSEEFGFVGSFILICLYSYLIFRLLLFSFKYKGMTFEFIFIIGVSIKLFLEVFINIGTNTGVIPATGIPLPIMSYGGSNILFTFFSLGVIQSIIVGNQDKLKEEKNYCIDNNTVLI